MRVLLTIARSTGLRSHGGGRPAVQTCSQALAGRPKGHPPGWPPPRLAAKPRYRWQGENEGQVRRPKEVARSQLSSLAI